MLQYITCNYNNLILVNKYYFQLIINSSNFQEKCKYKLSDSLFEFVNHRSIEKEEEKMEYFVSLIKDEEFIDRFFDIKYNEYQFRQNVSLFRVASKYSETLRRRGPDYKIFGKGKYMNQNLNWDWFYKKMKNNKDIEFYEKFFIITSFDLFKYCFEHVKMYRYDQICNKVYIDKKCYINKTYQEIKILDEFKEYLIKNN